MQNTVSNSPPLTPASRSSAITPRPPSNRCSAHRTGPGFQISNTLNTTNPVTTNPHHAKAPLASAPSPYTKTGARVTNWPATSSITMRPSSLLPKAVSQWPAAQIPSNDSPATIAA